jgi:hypothetical protein
VLALLQVSSRRCSAKRDANAASATAPRADIALPKGPWTQRKSPERAPKFLCSADQFSVALTRDGARHVCLHDRPPVVSARWSISGTAPHTTTRHFSSQPTAALPEMGAAPPSVRQDHRLIVFHPKEITMSYRRNRASHPPADSTSAARAPTGKSLRGLGIAGVT